MLRTEIYLFRTLKRTHFAAVKSNSRLLIFREKMLIYETNRTQDEWCFKCCPVSYAYS